MTSASNQHSLPALSMALPMGSVDAYVHRVNQIPMLTEEQERDLAHRWYYQKDVEAARQLVLSHLRFVASVARGFSGYGLAHADLIQEGTVGLMKAVKRFNPEVGVRLVSFAVHWIKAEMHEFILRNWRIVKIATTKAQRKLFFNLRKTAQKLGSTRLGWYTQAEVEMMAESLNVTTDQVRDMEQKLKVWDESFETPALDDEPHHVPAAYLEDRRLDPAHLLEHQEWSSNARSRLHEALAELDARSQDILRQRWLAEAGDRATLHTLAAQYNVSAERIRQLEKNAFKQLKEAMGSQRD